MIGIITIILIALVLSVDSLVASVTLGTFSKQQKIKQAFLTAIIFGIFQGLFFGLGLILGDSIKDAISSYDHWIAFGLLTLISLKIVCESFNKTNCSKEINPLNIRVLICLSVATSIDAIAVGLGLSLIVNMIFVSIIIVGIVTFIISFTGVLLGEILCKLIGKKIQLVGAIVLFIIGLKILIEHLF